MRAKPTFLGPLNLQETASSAQTTRSCEMAAITPITRRLKSTQVYILGLLLWKNSMRLPAYDSVAGTGSALIRM